MKNGTPGAKVFLASALAIIVSSIVGFGIIRQTNSIKIQVDDFEAYMIDDVAFVTWTTSAEISNGEVSLEKSTNGKDFNPVQKFKLNGIESKYTFVDEKPSFGLSYYRIKHSDNFKNEDIAPLINHDGPVLFEVSSKDDQIKLKAVQNSERTYLVSLTDDEGKHYLIQSVVLKRNNPVIINTRDLNLKSKEYVIRLQSSEWFTDKRISI